MPYYPIAPLTKQEQKKKKGKQKKSNTKNPQKIVNTLLFQPLHEAGQEIPFLFSLQVVGEFFVKNLHFGCASKRVLHFPVMLLMDVLYVNTDDFCFSCCLKFVMLVYSYCV